MTSSRQLSACPARRKPRQQRIRESMLEANYPVADEPSAASRLADRVARARPRFPAPSAPRACPSGPHDTLDIPAQDGTGRTRRCVEALSAVAASWVRLSSNEY